MVRNTSDSAPRLKIFRREVDTFGPTGEEEVEDGCEDLCSFGVQGGVEAANRIEVHQCMTDLLQQVKCTC
jgi:hypothetical protein